jgi:hypothetical protein
MRTTAASFGVRTGTAPINGTKGCIQVGGILFLVNGCLPLRQSLFRILLIAGLTDKIEVFTFENVK